MLTYDLQPLLAVQQTNGIMKLLNYFVTKKCCGDNELTRLLFLPLNASRSLLHLSKVENTSSMKCRLALSRVESLAV